MADALPSTISRFVSQPSLRCRARPRLCFLVGSDFLVLNCQRSVPGRASQPPHPTHSLYHLCRRCQGQSVRILSEAPVGDGGHQREVVHYLQAASIATRPRCQVTGVRVERTSSDSESDILPLDDPVMSCNFGVLVSGAGGSNASTSEYRDGEVVLARGHPNASGSDWRRNLASVANSRFIPSGRLSLDWQGVGGWFPTRPAVSRDHDHSVLAVCCGLRSISVH